MRTLSIISTFVALGLVAILLISMFQVAANPQPGVPSDPDGVHVVGENQNVSDRELRFVYLVVAIVCSCLLSTGTYWFNRSDGNGLIGAFTPAASFSAFFIGSIAITAAFGTYHYVAGIIAGIMSIALNIYLGILFGKRGREAFLKSS